MLKKNIFYLILLLPFVFLTIYFTRINFSEEISVTFNGISNAEFKAVNFYGTSPLNRHLVIYRTENVFNFSSLGNQTFINKFFLFLPDSIKTHTALIEFAIGDKKYLINNNNFSTYFSATSQQKGLYLFSFNKHKTSFFKIISAVFSWPENVRKTLLIVFIAIILLIIIVFIKTCRIFAGFRNWTKVVVSRGISSIRKFFLKRIFLKLCIFFTVFLFSLFVVIMHYGFYCNFSAFVFLLMLYGILLLLTFTLNLFLNNSFISNIRLTLTSLFLILIIIEFFLRFFNVNSSYLERNTLCYKNLFNKYKNSRYYVREPLMDVAYTTNEFSYKRKVYQEGFTQPMLKKKKLPNEYRILALGDSFTEGVGVDSDSCWVSLLKKKLTETYPDKFINTFNAGVVSSDPIFQYVLLTEKFNDLNFDMVIVATNESDQMDIVLRGGFERFLDDGTVMYKDRPKWEWLYGLSYIFRLVVINGLDYNPILMKDDDFQRKRVEALSAIFDVDQKFYNFAKENKMDLLLVFHPSQSEILNPNYFLLSRVIRKLKLQYSDINVIDLQDYFVNKLKVNRKNILEYFWKIDGHHNGKGYNAFATGIFEYIKDKKFIK